MKVFWAIIGVCGLLGAAWLGISFAQQHASSIRVPQDRESADTPKPVVAPVPPVSAPAPEPATPAPEAAPTPTPPPPDLEAIAKAQEAELRAKHPQIPVEVTPEVKPDPAAAAPASKPVPDVVKPAIPDVSKPVVAPPKPPASDPRSDELPSAGPTPIPENLPSDIGGYKVSAAEFVQKPDGSLLVDGRFVVKGLGTHDHPYEIPWELMTSVEQLFDPRSGKKEIPGRVAFLHTKHVRVSGYIAFPVLLKQPRELLAMLNQWDGCCIGVPPTPYDAVEVQLNKAVTGNNLTAIAGGVVGVFQVKPYVMGDWLVGLYLMEKAEFNPTDFGGLGGY